MEWHNVKRITIHFIKLLILLAILLWISSLFRPFNREVGAVATARKKIGGTYAELPEKII